MLLPDDKRSWHRFQLGLLFKSRHSRLMCIDELLAAFRQSAETSLHLGCGGKYLKDTINCDKFDDTADMKVDMCDLSGFQTGEVGFIESHHAVEHLSFKDAYVSMSEMHRVLSDGTYLAISCPDFSAVCGKWIRSSIADRFLDRKEARKYILKMVCGSQEHEGMFHRSHYDAKSMTQILEEIGFKVALQIRGYPSRPTPSLLTIAKKLNSTGD